jgi:hypothetical protein
MIDTTTAAAIRRHFRQQSKKLAHAMTYDVTLWDRFKAICDGLGWECCDTEAAQEGEMGINAIVGDGISIYEGGCTWELSGKEWLRLAIAATQNPPTNHAEMCALCNWC